MAVETFSIYQGICGLVTTKNVPCYFLIYYFLYIHHVIYILLPSFFLHISFISHFLSSGNSYHFIFWMLQETSNNCTCFQDQ